VSSAEIIADVTTLLGEYLSTPPGNTIGYAALDRVNPDTILNLYLYHIVQNAARMNDDLRWKTQPGQAARRPLVLSLRYLLTVVTENQIEGQKKLGAAMLLLHKAPYLRPHAPAVLPYEIAHVTLRPLGLDELEKIWGGVPGAHRLSVGYDVDVVVLEDDEPLVAPLPVLTRNIAVFPSVLARGVPTLDAVEIAPNDVDRWLQRRAKRHRTIADIDDTLLLSGEMLEDVKEAVIRSVRLPAHQPPHPAPFLPAKEVRVPPNRNADGSLALDEGRLCFALRKAERVADLVAGRPCSVELELKDGRKTNRVFFTLAPTFLALPVYTTADQIITITPEPEPLPEQDVELFVNGEPLVRSGSGFSFMLPNLDPDKYQVRLRVDGVDSMSLRYDPDTDGIAFQPQLEVVKGP
jgi:hypothetical protein